MRLPERFLSTLSRQFDDSGMGEEWTAFLSSFDQSPLSGIRGNLLKGIGREAMPDLLDRMGLDGTQPVPWSASGCVLPSALPPDRAPGRHPYYHAGLFYLQEPSAMLPAEILDARPGEHVMDLCAAPGGKSTRIAEGMRGKGLLFCNDIHADRARVLIRNLELHGVSNAVVLNEPPDHIADRLPGYFDRVLVDAPCSGEGMFRRDGRAVSGWDRFGPPVCMAMQREILHAADRMLRPGGILVYSTCTFNHGEDEGMVARFLLEHPGYEILPVPPAEGLSRGISLPADGGLSVSQAVCTVRIWPHRTPGEGHFCALLRKNGDSGDPFTPPPARYDRKEDLADLLRQADVRLSTAAAQRLSAAGSWIGTSVSRPDPQSTRGTQETHVHWLPEPPPPLDGLRVLKHGLYTGSRTVDPRGSRFEPSHSLLLTLDQSDLDGILDLPLEDGRVMRYLRGETLALQEADAVTEGRIPVFVDGHPLGWGKCDNLRMLKNQYPKAWRKMT